MDKTFEMAQDCQKDTMNCQNFLPREAPVKIYPGMLVLFLWGLEFRQMLFFGLLKNGAIFVCHKKFSYFVWSSENTS